MPAVALALKALAGIANEGVLTAGWDSLLRQLSNHDAAVW
jgi:hypothetical protein